LAQALVAEEAAVKRYLLAPGPTPVPPEVLAAMSQPILHHRTPQFSALFAEATAGLKELFQTQQDVLILAASGTGGMEGAVTNLLSPGDEVVVVNGGKFGERWLKICAAYDIRTHEVAVEWGEAVDPAAVEACLRAHPGVGAVLMQSSETSTTALHPVEAVARLCRDRKTLLVVDGITAVGVLDLPMDRWGIDVLVTGSQKALMLPPGLAFVALSERAWAQTRRARLPRFYFDFAREREALHKRTTAWTPAISLVVGLREALRLIAAEGLPQVFARHARLAAATRAGAEALGLRLLAPRAPSPAATGIWVPDGVDGARLVRALRDEMGVTMAGGQGHLTGKIVRIAHLGHVGAFDIVVGLAALEMALSRFGHRVSLGRGVGAAEAILREEWGEGRSG
jgi:aspartate aminotransferase-like enzyme